MKNQTMKALAWICLSGWLAASAARASDCFNSELSHFGGNLALASVTTVVLDKYCPKVKKPAKVGFFVSAAEAFVGEAVGMTSGSKFSLLDAGVGTLGAAVGAYATDKWYITPKVETQKRETTYAVMVSRRF